MINDEEIIVPIVFAIFILVFVGSLIWAFTTEDDKEKALCKEHNLEFLGWIYDENGKGSDYCGELKNGKLVKKYRIINDRYLEDDNS